MTETQVQSFLLTAEVGSISRAAEILYVSPSAISKQISLLESEWGFQLLERSKSGVTLTPGGKHMYDLLNEYQTKLQFAITKSKATQNNSYSPIQFGYREDWDISRLFSSARSDLMTKYPDTTIIPIAYRDEELLNRLILGQLDFIIATRDNISNNDTIILKNLTSLGNGLVFSVDHPLAKKEDLCLLDFKDDQFYLVSAAKDQDITMRAETKLKNVCRAYGFEPLIIPVTSVISAYSMVLCGQGVILVGEWSISRANTLMQYLPLDNLQTDICACWRKEDNDAAKQHFFDCLCNHLDAVC